VITVENHMKKLVSQMSKAQKALLDMDVRERGPGFWTIAGDAWRRRSTEVFKTEGAASNTPWKKTKKFKTVTNEDGSKKRVPLKGRASKMLRAQNRNRERLFPSLSRKKGGAVNERTQKKKNRNQVLFGTKIIFAKFLNDGTSFMPPRPLVEPTPKFLKDIEIGLAEYYENKLNRLMQAAQP